MLVYQRVRLDSTSEFSGLGMPSCDEPLYESGDDNVERGLKPKKQEKRECDVKSSRRAGGYSIDDVPTW